MLTRVSLLHLYKKFVHFCDIDIMAKCGVGNQELKSSSERKVSSVATLKTKCTKNWVVLHSYKKI